MDIEEEYIMKQQIGDAITHAEKVLLLFIVAGTIWAAGYDILDMFGQQGKMALGDLFLLFIYAEILGMIAAFYKSERIPVTLPLIIGMTALTRMLILQTKGSDAINIIYESVGILILATSAWIMTKKDYMSMKKEVMRESLQKEA